MFLAEAGMLFAIVGTLMKAEIVTYEWIIAGIIIGSVAGALMAIFMPMTAVPQRTAISHSFGAVAAVLVGIVEFNKHGNEISSGLMVALGFEVLFGALTVTGSLIAFGKLQEIITGVPITYKFQNVSNVTLFFLIIALYIFLIFNPTNIFAFYLIIALGLVIGILIVLPIGGADMPVVLSLLNSYAGLAAAATGFAINNKVLIIAGALDGASGFFLSILMSKAMNRSFANVLFGAVGSTSTDVKKSAEEKPIIRYTIDDAKFILENASSVVFVPGYGMAVAQAQHAIRELGEELEKEILKLVTQFILSLEECPAT